MCSIAVYIVSHSNLIISHHPFPFLHIPITAGGIPTAAAADPYHYALDARQRELEMVLHQRRHQLASQLQVEEEMSCKLTKKYHTLVDCNLCMCCMFHFVI